MVAVVFIHIISQISEYKISSSTTSTLLSLSPDISSRTSSNFPDILTKLTSPNLDSFIETMASKKGKNAFMSNTIAPPADAPSLDFESLDTQFQNLHVSKAPAKLDSSKGLDSLKPSSSSSKIVEPSSSSTVKSPTKNPPRSSIRKTQPPPYKTTGSTVKGSQPGGQSSSSVRHSERSPYPEDKKSHILSSRHTTERGQTSRQPSSQVSSSSHHQPSQISSHFRKTTQQTMPAGSRVKTEHYQVGNMDRTFFEGMVAKSEYDAHSPASAHKTHPLTQRTMAPSSARTILTDHEDLAMARRQTQYASLAPPEQAKQEKWAQSMIGRTGSCPEGFAWSRIHDGYQCNGGHHVITDELLAEGRGGVYALEFSRSPDDRWGPYYAEPSKPTLFFYRGPDPKPFLAPHTVGNGTGLTPIVSRTTMVVASRTATIHGSGSHGSRTNPSPRTGSRIGGGPQTGIPSSRFAPGSGRYSPALQRSGSHSSRHHGSGSGGHPSI